MVIAIGIPAGRRVYLPYHQALPSTAPAPIARPLAGAPRPVLELTSVPHVRQGTTPRPIPLTTGTSACADGCCSADAGESR